MKMWKKCGSGLVLLAGLAPALSAQVVPAVPAAPPAAAAAAGGAPGAAAPANLWSKLCLTPEQKAACKDKICNSKIGQLLNNGLKPMGALTGGMIGPFCPGFTQEDLKKPADSAEGAAARVKKDEAEAKARRAAVRFLGTVDCHYWPEAQDALVNSLRGDRNECVRWEAAMVLGSGCCCTKKTIEAMSITVSGSEADGNPRETSDRVRAAALGSLESCLARLAGPAIPLEPIPATPKEGVTPVPPVKEGAPTVIPGDPIGHYQRLDRVPFAQIVDDARRSAAAHRPAGSRPGMAQPGAPALKSPPSKAEQMNLLSVFKKTFSKPGETEEAPKTAARPAETPAPRQASEVRPVNFQAPPVAPARNGFPMTAPLSPPSTPVSNQSSRAPTPTPSGVVVASANPVQTWNVLNERPQLAQPATQVRTLLTVNPQQTIRTLRDAVDPEQREWAAVNLATIEAQRSPEVVEALIVAAGKDPAPTVRVACIRGLVRMHANSVPVVNTLLALQSDADPRVQREATLALQRLGGQGR